MSTIVAVRKAGQAVIAADTLTRFGDLKKRARYDRYHDKLQHYGQSCLGIVGSSAHVMVLDSALKRLDVGADFSHREAIFETLLRLHPVLKEHYYLNTTAEEDDPYESSQIDGLLVNRAGIFGIYALREVYEYTRFWAVGSGAEYALGAMQAVYHHDLDAEAIAKIGVEAGAEFDSASELPLTYHAVTLYQRG